LLKKDIQVKTADKQQFAALLGDVMAFYKQDTSPFALRVWWLACEKFALEQVAKAFTQHMTDAERGVFPPKPADVVRQLEGTATDRSMLAWGKLYEAMGRIGAYTDVVFDDPAIHAAVEDLGGWVKVCRSESSELSYLQHRFCEVHRAYSESGKFEYPRRLTGDRSSDSSYAAKGLPLPSPALVGDVERAKQVYQQGQLSGKTSIAFVPPADLAGRALRIGA
jgi:hypothetical protein